MSVSPESAGSSIMRVLNGHPTPDELAALIVVCTARARRAGPSREPAESQDPGRARWNRPDQNPTFGLGNSWLVAGLS
jgi:hypothetical protein